MKIIAKIILFFVFLLFVYLFLAQNHFFETRRRLDFGGEKTLKVIDNGLEYEVFAKALDVHSFVEEKKIKLGERDTIFPPRNTPLYPEMIVSINRAAFVEIKVDGKNLQEFTFSKTVADVLNEENIILSHLDETDPPKNSAVYDGLKITVTRIKTEEITVEEPIEFRTLEQKDNRVDWGVKKITQKGEPGIRETVYRLDYENGEEKKRTKLSSKITKNPVTEIVSIGTKLNIGKSISGLASWYETDDISCSSRDFPAGTWLRVTNLGTGKQVFVRVEGYGPQKETGKLIDLSKSAFKKLGSLSQGTTRVKVEEILNKGFEPD